MIKIGDRERIYADTFLIPEGESAVFNLPLKAHANNLTAEIQVTISFRAVTQGEKEGSVNYDLAGHNLTLTFLGWKNTLGTAFKLPPKIITIGNVDFGFNSAHFLFGNLHYLHFEFYKGGTYNA